MAKEEKKIYTLIEIALLAEAFEKSLQTIQRWINTNDYRLESDKARAAIKKTTV